METAIATRPQESPDNVQASDDSHLASLWLHGKALATQAAYTRDVTAFDCFTEGKTLRSVTLGDIQAFSDSLATSPASRRRTMAAVKSLFSFAAKIGYIRFDPAAAVKLPPVKDELAARIMPESSVQRILAMDTDRISPRNAALLRLLYVGGLRVSEACGLKWQDVQERGESCQVTVYGKGGKTRVVLLTQPAWESLRAIGCGASPTDPVFPSRKGKGHLSPVQVFRIVRAAARIAGIEGNVSPHWLRHCHASHSLDNGASVSLVSATLGHSSVAVTSRYLHARPDSSSATYIRA